MRLRLHAEARPNLLRRVSRVRRGHIFGEKGVSGALQDPIFPDEGPLESNETARGAGGGRLVPELGCIDGGDMSA
ncbi:hypothetical protein GCM10010172_41250 [Paractinoplanes ferrugineus]|uniref:Uncharacterized protein n=1 Tax=Paractinoplanes ferrugineus TaxID=113564 RepID=A0A919MGY8_9ACTN|nr:hypothetical protein Afe05nite_39450 [Actinoplanes ferrugineus]